MIHTARDARAIRVLCVDDHAVVREGIVRIVNRQPDMRVVATAGTAEEAIAEFRRHQPDITLMDLQLPSMNGLAAIRAIRRHAIEARIVVLTMYQGDEDIHRAIEAGAATYLLKSTLTDDLTRVIREVHAGERPLPADVRAALEAHGSHPRLTPRETQVVELVAAGQRNKEIAASLRITEETVEVHMKNLFAKLGVNDRTAAVKVALRRGIVHLM